MFIKGVDMLKSFLVFEDCDLGDVIAIECSLVERDFFMSLTVTGYMFAKVFACDDSKAKSLFRTRYDDLSFMKLKNSEMFVIREFSKDIGKEQLMFIE